MGSKTSSDPGLIDYVLLILIYTITIISFRYLGKYFSWPVWIRELLVIFSWIFVFELFHRYRNKDFPSIISFFSKRSTLGRIRYFSLIIIVFVGLNMFSGLGNFYFRYYDTFTLAITFYLILFSSIR